MTVCMICTGNTCRSPMAEALLRRALESRGVRGITVCSAGIWAADGAPASAEAVEALREYDLDLSGHRARGIQSAPADALYLCMTRTHLEALKRALPGARAHLFLEYAGLSGEVSDPYGMDAAAYRMAASKLMRAAESAADRLMKEIEKGE